MPEVFSRTIKGYKECPVKGAGEVMKIVTDTVVTSTKEFETKIAETKASESAIFAKYTKYA